MDGYFILALLRLLIFLPLVLGLAYVTVRFGLGRATGRVAGPGQLELIERLPLSSKSGLAVVRCGGRYFLVGQGEGVPVLLAELPDYQAVTAAGEVEVEVCPLQSLVDKENVNSRARVRGKLAAWLAKWQGFKNHGI